MEGDFNLIIKRLEELLAVETLESINKNWLIDSELDRSKQKQIELNRLIFDIKELKEEVLKQK